MSDWQSMDTAPKDGSVVIIAFDSNQPDGFDVASGYFDDGEDEDGEVVEEPGWFWFDQHETGPVTPIRWQPYPTLDRAGVLS